ncbi:restriction endonuclease subunit S [Xanthomonas oryzae]|uniref:Restriction endonuclease subunit S n=2 Tax=Xanthomonas oryzae TaxID=347 RepID=A0AAJ5ME53_XANOO|nr:restriction endonuclease subunit S [Xanthomonas oryzae]QIE20721.1 restriction endonuclease subunit S [Xanthomonas oryzae pv. oryzae]UXV79798.1 restriction endonuclease subunit S [Xanthomonas oryzae pv. oryzae]UXW02420.1 restriction endonuclease subunit S [Xanthomonas oryzae pv. oryzae]UXW17451.1 restriction endonuclease subunit S [Xanthomonas oryzae pv. oryzae]UXW21240.1 restriction endonuclease subunit S [Xanthomonas oryzae pv. oryzae]
MSDTPNIDIRPDHWQIVRDILRKHVPQYAVWAFGSRAKWLAKQYSDLDLAIITDQPLSLSISAALADDFSESDLPWKVDVVDWAATGKSFQQIIERDRVVVQKSIPGPSSGMVSEWRDTNWGEEISLEYGKAIRGYDEVHGKYRVFGSNGAIGWTGEALTEGPGVILGRKGAYRGVRFWRDPFWVIDTAYYVVPKEKLDMRWIYYAIKHHRLGEIDDGSPIPSTTRAAVYVRELMVPSLKEQRAIACILGALDDKIELNQRMNQTLEAMARALFKSWFVDFDGVPPDDMQESELGLIPKGWRISTVGQEVAIVGGSTPSTTEVEHWAGGTHNWVTPKDLSSLCFPVLLATERKITDFGLSKIASGILPVGTLLLSSRAPIGYLAITEVPTAINQGFIAMKCEGVLSNVFMLNWCREKMDFIFANANGSTFLEISKSNFRPLPVIVPSAQALHAFDQYARPLHQRIVESERQSQALIQIRDTLLPKLLSGELRVKDAERIAGSA